jgi:hypothetical protein
MTFVNKGWLRVWGIFGGADWAKERKGKINSSRPHRSCWLPPILSYHKINLSYSNMKFQKKFQQKRILGFDRPIQTASSWLSHWKRPFYGAF